MSITYVYRYFYFFGRILSFTLAGMIAGAIGAVSTLFFKEYHLSEVTTYFFGATLLVLGFSTLLGGSYPGHEWVAKRLSSVTKILSLLMLQDKALPAFLFGFFTLALPCGQSLIVFSACALSGSLEVGLINGFIFALLTTPSLLLSMQAHVFFQRARHHYRLIIGLSALLVGTLAILRGLADQNLIDHLIINLKALESYPIIIF